MGKPKRENIIPEQAAAIGELLGRPVDRHLLLVMKQAVAAPELLAAMHERLKPATERKAETAPPRPQEPTPQRRKRKPGAGRKRSLTPKQIKDGIGILRNEPKMSIKNARRALRKAGIDSSDAALYRLVIAPAYGVSN